MTQTGWLFRIVVAQWVVIFYPGVIIFWLIVHSGIDRLRRFGTRAYWVAVFAWTMTSTPILYYRKEVFSLRFFPPPGVELLMDGLGTMLFVTGAALYFLAKQQITSRTMAGLPELKPDQRQPLLHRGISSRKRNPLYLGYWLILLAAAMFTNYAANWVMFAVNCALLPFLIRAGERELIGRYGVGVRGLHASRAPVFPAL